MSGITVTAATDLCTLEEHRDLARTSIGAGLVPEVGRLTGEKTVAIRETTSRYGA